MRLTELTHVRKYSWVVNKQVFKSIIYKKYTT